MHLADFLSQIPLFQSFDDKDLQKLADLFEERSVDKGTVICRQGDPGESLFLIFSGELEVWSETGAHRLLNRMGAGEIFGEVAMLLEGKRTSTVTVKRQARIFELNRREFENHFLNDPRKIKSLYQIIANRLTQMATADVPSSILTIISVMGPSELKGKTLLANAVSALIQKFSTKKSLIIRLHERQPHSESRYSCVPYSKVTWDSKPFIFEHIQNESKHRDVLNVELDPLINDTDTRQCLCKLFENVRPTYEFVVIDFESNMPRTHHAVINESDIIVRFQQSDQMELVPQNASQKIYRVINHYNPGAASIPVSGIDPFVLEKDPEIEFVPAAERTDYICNNSKAKISRPIHRLVRKILGCSVGVALGGGAAFGLSHIGVLKTFDDHDIPVDLLTGTSMGSAIAIGYAAGLDGNEMLDMTQKMGTIGRTLSAATDLSLFSPGLLQGRALKKVLSHFANGCSTFNELQVPCRTVATDIENGERVSIDAGRLDDAIRSSSSVPLVWSPVKHKDRVLVDGAINDPVPAETVREMGADICIAINVVPPLEKGTQTFLSRLYKQINILNPVRLFNRQNQLPNLFETVMNSIQTLQYELGNFKAISADILINPDLRGYTWVEFYKPMDFINKGIEATDPKIPNIQQMLAQQMA